ncbi:hypothetical protein N9T06_00515 [Flavobacteriaceae bacterium]|nr:hypothetical protein [Flavobacteriaceae bacterium]
MKRFIIGFFIFIGTYFLILCIWVFPWVIYSLNPEMREKSPFPDSWHERGIFDWQNFPEPIWWISGSSHIIAFLLASLYVYKKGLKK